MSESDDCASLVERLTILRRRLAHDLLQLARFGEAHAPPPLTADIQEARLEIWRILDALRRLGRPAEPHPDDAYQPDMGRAEDLSSGVSLFAESPAFRSFHRTPRLDALLATIAATPGYHVVEAPMGYGKTALVSQLWRELELPGHARLAYLFSADHGRTRVNQAVRSIFKQLRELEALPPGLPEEDTALTPQVLRVAAGRFQRCYLLIDGLDECAEAERAQLGQLLPDLHLPNLTVVLTTRPDVRSLVLRHLPFSHCLRDLFGGGDGAGAFLHALAPLSAGEIASLLGAAAEGDPAAIAARVFERSQGIPLIALDYLRRPGLLDEPGHDTVPVERFYQRARASLEAACPPAQRELLPRLLALLGAARSPLALADLEELLGAPRADILALRELLARYQHLTSAADLALDSRFREHLAAGDDTAVDVAAAGVRLAGWATAFAAAPDVTAAPLYALRHAAEYLAATPRLRAILARPEWFVELERRARARSACVAAVERARAEAERGLGGPGEATAVVNLILCCLARAALSAVLLPELVAELVRLGLWTREVALDYGQNYVSAANREALASLLTQPGRPPSLPPGSAVADIAVVLGQIAALPSPARDHALARWQRSAEQIEESADTGGRRARLAVLAQALRMAPQAGGGGVSYERLGQDLAALQTYTPPPTGPLSDPGFGDLVAQLADAWWQIPQRELAWIWLQPILGAVSRFSYADLVEALEILAPALRTIFPTATPELCEALPTVGAALG